MSATSPKQRRFWGYPATSSPVLQEKNWRKEKCPVAPWQKYTSKCTKPWFCIIASQMSTICMSGIRYIQLSGWEYNEKDAPNISLKFLRFTPQQTLHDNVPPYDMCSVGVTSKRLYMTLKFNLLRDTKLLAFGVELIICTWCTNIESWQTSSTTHASHMAIIFFFLYRQIRGCIIKA